MAQRVLERPEFAGERIAAVMRRMPARWFELWTLWGLAAVWILAGCEGSGREPAGSRQGPTVPNRPTVLSDDADVRPDSGPGAPADIGFLVFGNSHVQVASPFAKLKQMVESQPGKPEVALKILSGSHLDAFVPGLKELGEMPLQPDTTVILQGQKTSMSGRQEFSVDAAVDLAVLFRKRGASVLLMPEWSMLGNAGEAGRILAIHRRIAAAANADAAAGIPVAVVPVGLVWEKILAERPDWILHSQDGNHSGELGGVVTALTFYCWIFGTLPAEWSVPGGMAQEEQLAAIVIEVCSSFREEQMRQ